MFLVGSFDGGNETLWAFLGAMDEKSFFFLRLASIGGFVLLLLEFVA